VRRGKKAHGKLRSPQKHGQRKGSEVGGEARVPVLVLASARLGDLAPGTGLFDHRLGTVRSPSRANFRLRARGQGTAAKKGSGRGTIGES
jgi:hypothetical protein